MARRLFLATLAYLPLLLGLMVADRLPVQAVRLAVAALAGRNDTTDGLPAQRRLDCYRGAGRDDLRVRLPTQADPARPRVARRSATDSTWRATASRSSPAWFPAIGSSLPECRGTVCPPSSSLRPWTLPQTRGCRETATAKLLVPADRVIGVRLGGAGARLPAPAPRLARGGQRHPRRGADRGDLQPALRQRRRVPSQRSMAVC